MSVVWHVTTSLDGFIAGPDGTIDGLFVDAGPSATAATMPGRVGAVLAGRRSWDAAPDVRPYDSSWPGQVFVLTHRPPEPRPGFTFLTGDLAAAVATARAAAGELDLVVTGADVAGQCLAAGLVDELQLHVSPVLLGAGTRLFDRAGAARLELVASCSSGGVLDLRYRVLDLD